MIKEILSQLRAFRWQKLLIIWAVFVAMAAILFAERSGIQYEAAKFKLNYLPRTEVEPAQTAMFGQPVTCLLLYDSGQDSTDLAKKQFDRILLDMKVSTQAVDVHTTSLEGIPEFDRYKTVVVLMSDLDALGSRLIDLMNWVKDGGSVLFAMTPQKTTYFDAISPNLGVLSSSWEYKTAESIVPAEEFMLGGGERYEFSDPFQSSLSVSLREEATVYARTGDEGVPLVWGTKSGCRAGWWWTTSASTINHARHLCSVLQPSVRCRCLPGDQQLGVLSGRFSISGTRRRWYLYPQGLRDEYCGFLFQGLVAGSYEACTAILHPFYRCHDRKL